jgi:hypothetical protein
MMETSAVRVQAVARASATASLLALGGRIDDWGRALLLLALAALLWAPAGTLAHGAMLASILAGILEIFLALRVAFDERIFRAWAHVWQQTEAPPEVALREFDEAMSALGLSTPPNSPQRNLDSRMRGARRLFLRQLAAFLVQLAACLAALVLAMLH